MVAHELDVVSTEFSEEAAMQSGDMTRTGTVRPFGIKSAVEAKLHVRVANIGHTSEGPKGKLERSSDMRRSLLRRRVTSRPATQSTRHSVEQSFRVCAEKSLLH